AEFRIRLVKHLGLTEALDRDIGMKGLGLSLDGGSLQVSLDADAFLGFGVSKNDGFYFITAPPPGVAHNLSVAVDVTAPGLDATGRLAFLQLHVRDHGPPLGGSFVVDVTDPSHDGRLTFSELTAAGLSAGDLIDARFTATAHVDLLLSADFGSANFP